jgi:hypothetical protein
MIRMGMDLFLDVDDDGDGYGTKNEIKRPNITVNGSSTANGYYPYMEQLTMIH